MPYASDVEPITLLQHAFFGTGGFRDGTYLVQYPRESDDKYARRRKAAYYVNYVRPIVEAHVKPIFRRGIKRTDGGANPSWTAFVADCTMGGVDLERFMRDRAVRAKRSGCDLIVVTAPADAPMNQAEEIEKRPYVYGVEASRITDLVRDASERVVSVSFTEGHDVQGSVETWTKTVTSSGWELVDQRGFVQQAGEWDNPRQDAPVVLLAPGDWIDGEMLPISEFYSIARCAAALYNLGSESHEIIRSVTFPILSYPSKDLKGLVIGLQNALGYDPDKPHRPEFISPPDGPLEQLRLEREGLVREMYRMAMLAHQVGTGESLQAESAKSGVAMRIDREDYDTALAFYSASIEAAETRIREIFAWIQGADLVDASAVYPRDFTMQDEATQLQPLFDALASLATMPGPMRAAVYSRVAEILLPGHPELEQIKIEIAQGFLDEVQSRMPGGDAGA
jgi:hypothetical protein